MKVEVIEKFPRKRIQRRPVVSANPRSAFLVSQREPGSTDLVAGSPALPARLPSAPRLSFVLRDLIRSHRRRRRWSPSRVAPSSPLRRRVGERRV